MKPTVWFNYVRWPSFLTHIATFKNRGACQSRQHGIAFVITCLGQTHDVGRDGLTTKLSWDLVGSFSSLLLAVQLCHVLTETIPHWNSKACMRGQVFCVLYVNTTLFGQCFFFFFLPQGAVKPFVFSLKISLSIAADVVYTLLFAQTAHIHTQWVVPLTTNCCKFSRLCTGQEGHCRHRVYNVLRAFIVWKRDTPQHFMATGGETKWKRCNFGHYCFFLMEQFAAETYFITDGEEPSNKVSAKNIFLRKYCTVYIYIKKNHLIDVKSVLDLFLIS